MRNRRGYFRNRPMPRQYQITVRPETSTFEEIEGGRHFGYCLCPFCDAKVVLVGPKEGRGLVWSTNNCEHSEGAVAGHGFEITVLFRGIHTKPENEPHGYSIKD